MAANDEALGGGGLAEEFRHPAVAEQLSPGHLAAQQLAELGNDDGGRRVEIGAGVEDDIGAIDVAGEGQQLGQEDPGADIGRRPAHRGIGRRQRVGKIAFAEQTTGFARVGCSSGRKRHRSSRPAASSDAGRR